MQIQSDITLSIIIPCKNEEKTIGICIEKAISMLKKKNLKGEIIVSDNSTDKSTDIAIELGARVVIPKYNGYGNAFIEGIKHSQGKYYLFVDGDNTYDLNELPKFIDPLMEDRADFVIGNRLKDIKKGSMPWLHRYIGNPLLTWILNKLFNTAIGDAHCGMRAISRYGYEKLDIKSEGMEFASEMIIESARKGLRIAEVPISYYPRVTPSKLDSWLDGWRHLRFMMLYNPTPFLFIPGFLIFLLGLLLTFIMITGDSVTKNFHSFILGSLMAIIGIQMISTGSYIKIYGIIHNKIDKNGIASKILDYHSLEIGLIIGAFFFFLGIIFGADIIWRWISSGYGSLYELRNAVIVIAFISIGMQIIFSTLLVSIFLLDKKNSN